MEFHENLHVFIIAVTSFGDISFILILNNSVGNVINFTHIKRFSVDKRVESSIRYYILSIE